MSKQAYLVDDVTDKDVGVLVKCNKEDYAKRVVRFAIKVGDKESTPENMFPDISSREAQYLIHLLANAAKIISNKYLSN